MDDEPTEQESSMLGMLREWSGTDDCKMVIEIRDGAWEIAMTVTAKGKPHTARGVGKTFKEAWDNMNPTWA